MEPLVSCILCHMYLVPGTVVGGIQTKVEPDERTILRTRTTYRVLLVPGTVLVPGTGTYLVLVPPGTSGKPSLWGP